MSGITVKVTQAHGTDYYEDTWLCCVGEVGKRFPAEELREGGAAWDWINTTLELIRRSV